MEISFLKQRRISAVILGILAIVFGWVEFYLVYSLISMINSLRFNNIFEGLVLIIRFIIKTALENVHVGFSYIFLFLVVMLVATLLFSILLYFVFLDTNYFLEGNEQKVKKLYLKSLLNVWKIVIIDTILVIFGGVFLTIVSVPALVVTAAFVNGKVNFVYCMFFDLITVLTILSTLTYIRIPIWSSIKNSISTRKTDVSNEQFKKMVIILLSLDVLFIISRIITVALRLNFNGTISLAIQFLIIIMLNMAYFTYKILNILKTLND